MPEQTKKSYLMGEEELEAISNICFGAPLDSFDKDRISSLMLLAAVVHHTDGWKEVPDNRWTIRLAQTAVTKDYRAIENVPEKLRIFCVKAFCSDGAKITRHELSDFRTIFNSQSYDFIFRSLRADKAMERFIDPEMLKKRKAEKEAEQGKVKKYDENKLTGIAEKARKDSEKAKESQMLKGDREQGNYRFDFSCLLNSAAVDTDQDAFLMSDLKDKTEKRLVAVVNSDNMLRPDFIKQLIVPNRNYQYYSEHGDKEKAEYWKERIIPYLTPRICSIIAAMHPEASCATPEFLTKEAVAQFWEKHKTMTKAEKTKMFLQFPEQVLDASATEDIIVNAEVLKHAPSLFCNCDETGTHISDRASTYLNQHPGDILFMPECYQTVGRLLNSRVPLTQYTLQYIKNEEIREKIALALGI